MIGFIGLGNMASAIIGGLLKKKLVLSNEILGTDKLPEAVERCKKEYGIESLPEMTCGEHGKPYFKNADIKFNLSHCGGLAVCVVSSDEVGIDCEKTGRVSLKEAGRIFSPYENEMLEKLTGEEQARFFSYVWTAKEAYCKATGQGLFSGLSQRDFGDNISEYGGFYFARHIFIQNNAEYIVTAACREPHFDYIQFAEL